MRPSFDLKHVPRVSTYVSGLSAIGPEIKPEHFRIFQAQYDAPHHTANASDIAELAAIKGGHAPVNRLYGGLAHLFCDATGFVPELRPDYSRRWWSVWSIGYSTKDRGFLWEMRPEVIEALEGLGWIQTGPLQDSARQEGLDTSIEESMRCTDAERRRRLASAPKHAKRLSVTRPEFQRNPDVASVVLIGAKGHCDLCGTPAPFERASNGTPYLEIHHIVPLSKGGEDTIRNAVALCANCHRFLHYGTSCEHDTARLKNSANARSHIVTTQSGPADYRDV